MGEDKTNGFTVFTLKILIIYKKNYIVIFSIFDNRKIILWWYNKVFKRVFKISLHIKFLRIRKHKFVTYLKYHIFIFLWFIRMGIIYFIKH